MNLLWDSGTLRIRDIHVFDEHLSDQVKKENGAYPLITLPFVDGFVWSDLHFTAGLRLKVVSNGVESDMRGGQPIVSDSVPGHLLISWPLEGYAAVFHMDITEKEVRMHMSGETPTSWYLALSTASGASLPFLSVKPHEVSCRFKGVDYSVLATKGQFEEGAGVVFRVKPAGDNLVLEFAH